MVAGAFHHFLLIKFAGAKFTYVMQICRWEEFMASQAFHKTQLAPVSLPPALIASTILNPVQSHLFFGMLGL
jgi:hypothetical protein